MRTALYRSRQFFGALRPRIDAQLRDEAFGCLNDGQRALFASMTPRDQQHCLDVYRALRVAGHDDGDLLAAALLHDAGKGSIALWHRVAYVVLEATAPGALRRYARPGDGTSAREALHRCLHHEALGAERARAAGSSERTVALIAGEADDSLREPLRALQAADNAA